MNDPMPSLPANAQEDGNGTSRLMKVIVLCTNSQGVPEFYGCAVQATADEYAEGQHYEMAKAQAQREGYEAPMMAFDGGDTAAKQLGEMLAWI